MFYFLYPWALVSLLSLAAILFLYFFVFRGKPIEVSSLHLWRMARSLRLEGQHRQKPPVTVPLVLELLAALLLSLLAAGFAFKRQAEFPYLVVILDGSASMNAGMERDSFRARAGRKVKGLFKGLGPSGRITLVESGFEPAILGKEAMAEGEAMAVLEGWRPCGPDHSLQPAAEVARALSGEDAVPVLLTDHPMEIPGVKVAAIGAPLENTGWVGCQWRGSSELFALVQHFGESREEKTVKISGDGKLLGEIRVDFSQRQAVPLKISIPQEAASLLLELPPDSLENDDVLRIARPKQIPVTVRVDVGDESLEEDIRRAVQSTFRGALTSEENPSLLFCLAGSGEKSGSFLVSFHVPEQGGELFAGPFVVHGTHPLTCGVDLQGTVWAADPGFRGGGGAILLSLGEIPLAVLHERTLTLNLDPRRTSIFNMPAWPVLVANVVEYVYELSPGLKRNSFRLGESLAFYKPSSWKGRVTIQRPDGEKALFDGDPIYYGRLEREGIYRILCNEKEVASLDVNLLSEAESDLTRAGSLEEGGGVESSERRARAGRAFHREFALLLLAALLFCWYLLERRGA